MFAVIELQKTGNQMSNIVQTYTDQNEAESRFHAILSAAAISQVEVHSAFVMDEECRIYQSGVYHHPKEATE